MNQEKNGFLNKNYIETHLILSYHIVAPGTTSILSQLKLVEAISLQQNEIYFNQRKLWIWVPCWCASWTSMSNM